MSVEKQARKALRRMFLWRVVGELFVLPRLLCQALQALVVGLAQWFRHLEMAVFILELDAARRYKLLTGLDMGTASGEPGRYALTDPQRNEDFQQRFVDSHGQGEDE